LSARPVLIDTSVWVELFRLPSHGLRPLVEDLIAGDQARICAAVAAELIQGATTAKDLEAAEDLAEAIPSLQASDETWTAAGRLSQKLRMKGAVVGLLDCYLAELALAHRCSILSLDKHFPLIAKHAPLEVLPLP
jgi:predicted nucleic acid-binding protein